MEHITFDSREKAWQRLGSTLRDYDVALFLGAGVSINNKMPTWNEFVAKLGGWSPAERSKLADAGMSPATLCEIAKRGVPARKWTTRVRSAIYEEFEAQVGATEGLSLSDFGSKHVRARERVSNFFRAENPVLWEIVRACGVKGSNGEFEMNERIGAVLTTNVDALLQLCDRAIHGSPGMLRTIERASAETEAGKISLYQLHGYLLPPQAQFAHRPGSPSSGEAADGLVLGEAEYLGRTDGPYTWANVMLHWAVREFSVIFVGCSMTDELVRRALHRSCLERMAHHTAKRSGKLESEETLRKHFAVMPLSGDDLVDRALNESAATLGVWPLWVRDFDKDLPAKLQQVVQGKPRRSRAQPARRRV